MNDLLEKFRQQAFNLAMSTVPDFPFGIEDCIMKYAPGYYSREWGKKTWFFNITW